MRTIQELLEDIQSFIDVGLPQNTVVTLKTVNPLTGLDEIFLLEDVDMNEFTGELQLCGKFTIPAENV